MPVFDIVDGELSLPEPSEAPKPAKTRGGKDDGRYDELFAKADADNNLPSGMTKAIANAETGFLGDWDRRLRAVSPVGAQGPVQFMPATGRRYGLNSIDDLRNPEKAIPAAGKYLADIRDTVGFDDPAIMAAGYNAGEHNKYVRAGKVPPPSFAKGETNKYVKNVMDGLSRFGSGMDAVRQMRGQPEEAQDEGDLFSLEGVRPIEELAPASPQAEPASPAVQPVQPPSLLQRGKNLLTDAGNAVEDFGYNIAMNPRVGETLTPPPVRNLMDEERARLAKPPELLKSSQPYLDLENRLQMNLNPQFVEQVKQAYEAGSPEYRQQLMRQPGEVGQVAKYIDQQYQKAVGVTSLNPALDGIGGRREDITQRNLSYGMEPQSAQIMADREVRFPGAMKPTGQAQSTTFDFDRFNRLKEASPVTRGVEQGVDLLKSQAAGLNKMAADLGVVLGVPGAAEYGRAQTKARGKLGMRQNEMGEASNAFNRNLEGAIASTISNAPALVAGLFTGGEAIPLMGMGAQVAGDEYARGLEEGLTPQQSLARAVSFGAAEVLGEKLGFKGQLDLLKKTAKGNWADFEKLFVKNMAEQVIGEEFTTAAEARIDGSPVGLNKELTTRQLFDQMKDTLYQTVLQTTIMGAPGAVGAGVRSLKKTDARYDQPYADAFKLIKDTPEAAAAYDQVINTRLGELRKDPEFRAIMENETDKSRKDAGLERGNQARQILAERRALRAKAPTLTDIQGAPAQGDLPEEETTISSTGIPGDTNAQDPAGASTAPAEPTGTTQAPVQERQSQTVDAAQGQTVNPDIAPEIRPVSDGTFQIVDTNTGTVISQHPTAEDAFEALDQLNASLSTGSDRETTTATQETTNEGQNQEANAGTSGQEGLLNLPGQAPGSIPMPAGGQVIPGTTERLNADQSAAATLAAGIASQATQPAAQGADAQLPANGAAVAPSVATATGQLPQAGDPAATGPGISPQTLLTGATNANDPTTGTGEIAPGTAATIDLAQGAERGAGTGAVDGGDRPASGSVGGDGGATAAAPTANNPVSEPALAPKTPDEVVAYYFADQNIGQGGALDDSARTWANRTLKPTAMRVTSEWRPTQQFWKRKSDESRQGYNRALKILVNSGYAQIAWDIDGNPYYAKAGSPVPDGLYTEGNHPLEKSQAQSSNSAPVLQNRNRSNPASVQQMQSIAGNPDYLRLSPSRNFADGAPVIAGGQVPAVQMGRKETTVTAKGRRIPVQYAVVEADSVLASNNADGTVNAQYGDTAIQAPRAIAGNGRIAGLQKAYRQGSAGQYRSDLAADDLHGISPDVINGMKAPVLVRVMPESELTQDIGDESNIAGGLSLSPVEQARNDAARLDLEGLDFDEDGTLGRASVLQFVRSMPESEQGGLLDADGTPNRQAHDRLNSAVFQKAYENDELVRLHSQAVDPDAKLVMSTLSRLAPKFSRLKGKGLFDTRGWLADAAKAIVNGRRRDLTMQQIADQQDLDIEPQAYDIIRLFADNPRSNKAVIEDLSDFADFAYNEATRDTQDMFGETPRATQNDLRKRLENYRERRGQKDLAKRSRDKSVSQRTEEAAADAAGPNNAQETAGGEQGLFAGPTAEDRARADREALAEAQREQQRKSNATQAPPADDGLFALDNRQDQLKFSLRPDEQQQRIRKLNRGIDAQNRRYAGGDKGDARSRVELAAPEDVPAARRIEWKLASAIAAVFKHNLIPVRGENGGRLNFDAVVDPNGDPSSIFITVDSVNPISRVVAHELLHGLRLNAPKIYDNLVKSLRQLYDADALVDYVNSRDYAGELTDANEEEWVADFVSNVINSPDGLVKVAFAMNRNKAGSGFNFLRRVQGLVERIKQGLAGTPLGANKVIAKSDLKAAEDAVIEALAQYAAHQEKGTQPSGPLKFSNRTKAAKPAFSDSLVTLHNLTEENLAQANAIGGLPAPSLGITKASSPFTGFGEITLIGDKGLIDPEAGTPVFDRDAWTSRFPEFKFKKIKASKADAFYERMKPARGMGDDGTTFTSDLFDRLRNDRNPSPDRVAEPFTRYLAPKMLYARDVLGKSIKIPTRDYSPTSSVSADPDVLAFYRANEDAIYGQRDTSKEEEQKARDELARLISQAIDRIAAGKNRPGAHKEAMRLNFFSENGEISGRGLQALGRDAPKIGTKIEDTIRLTENIQKVVPDNDPAYLKWVKEQVSTLFDEPTITLRGRQVPPTLDNLVAAMTTGATQGAEKSMTFGSGKASAHLGKQFQSIAEIQAARNQVVSEEVEADGRRLAQKVLENYQQHVIQFYGGKDYRGQIDTWSALDDAMEVLAKAGKLADTDGNIRLSLQKKGFRKVDAEAISLARQAIGALRDVSTNYFEAKPQRAVKLNEFSGAVAPKGLSPDSLDILKSNGLTVELYGKGEGAREKAIAKLSKSLEKTRGDVLFSNRPTPLVEEPLQDDLFRQQLDLFLDSDLAGQPGPKTEAARREAVAAVESLRRDSGSVLGARLADTYAARQRVSLVGHTLTSREDLATLAQVYRDTRFETFRLFFTNQEGKIVSQVGLTSRLPASSAVIVGTDVKQYMTDLAKAASKVGATHYYMLHNHPSTNPMPSEQDVRMTQLFNRELNLISNGHVVIDTNQFGFIKPSGDVEIIKKDFGQVSPYKTNEFSDTAILNPESLMEVAKKLEVDQDAVTLVVTTAQQKVLGVTTVPADTIRSGSRALRGLRIRKILKSMSGARVFAVGTHRPTLLQLGHLVMDAIYINESGEYVSVNRSMSGAYGQADPFEIRGRQVPRVTADTSAEFDYLRDQTLMARGGGMGSALNVSEPKFSNRPNPTFFSQLARGFESSKMNSMPGSQWRAWLFSNKAKLGIKDDEIAWTGIEDYLTLNAKEKLTKADIASYLADNGVRVDDVMKGGDKDKSGATWASLNKILKQEDNLGYDRSNEAASDLVSGRLDVKTIDVPEDVRSEISDLIDQYRQEGLPTKFSQYTLPGGTNYRELLVTLPEREQPAPFAAELKSLQAIPYPLRTAEQNARERELQQAAMNVPNTNYRSGHWDEPNVLAHIRFDERTDADGKRVMFITELQSDWGQEGKKKGFQEAPRVYRSSEIILASRDVRREKFTLKSPDGIFGEEFWDDGEYAGDAGLERARARAAEIFTRRSERQANLVKDNPPAAPFVTDTKSWLSLGLKRAIRYAAENGFDKIAFANGQQNADLYDLSKQVKSIAVPMVNSDGSRSVRIDPENGTAIKLMVDKNGVVDGVGASSEQFTGKTLDDVVGKEIADRILSTTEPTTFSGDGLKVGGEGMRKFYDQIVPQTANDVLKKLGGPRVGTVRIGGVTQEILDQIAQADYDSNYDQLSDRSQRFVMAVAEDRSKAQSMQQPGFDITPALQDKALSGMPLFSNRRNVLNQPALATWTTPDDSQLDDWAYKLQDKHIDTKRIVEKLGSRVSDAWDPYLKETLYHGRAAKDVDDFKVNEIRPLLQAMSTRGITIGELETFLHNRHAKEANEQIARINDAYPDGGSGILTQDAQDYLANLPAGKRTDLEALAAQIDAITAGTRRLLVEAGLETQDTIDAWEATYSDYVPLQRESEDVLNRGMGTGQGFSIKGSASKRRTGSGKNVVDIMANVMMQRERAITRAEKNKVGLALYGLAIQNPNPEFWYPVNPDAMKKPASVAQELVNNGMLESDLAGLIQEPTVASVNPRTGLVEYKINPALRNRDNVLAVRIKGKDRFLFFSTENERAVRMAASLKNLDAPEMHGLLNAFRIITRYVSSINTQYNPIFGVVNLLRDAQGAMLNLSTTPIAGRQADVAAKIAPAMAGIYGDLRADRKGQPRKPSQWSQLWEEFQAVGGKTGYRDMYATAEDRAKALETELNKIQDGTAKRLTRGLFDWLSDYNETLENAVRLSAYKVGTENGMSKEQAAVMAKELTVNFNRKGQIASQAGALYAFFNAAVQGTARLAETAKGPAGKKIIAGGLIMGVVQAMMMAAAGYDDDEPPEFLRERNFIIPMPNGKYVSIPMPLGFHVLPNTGRVLTEIAINPDGAGKKIAGLLGSFFEAFNPIGSAGWSVQTIAPTFADPLVALTENRDAFGKEIAKKDRSSTSPTPGFTRTKDTASRLSKHLAWGINALTGGTDYTQGAMSPTPDQLDYLFGQATGGVGREVMKIEQAASSWMSGEELPPYKYPLGVGRFFGDTKSQAADANRFYANITKLNEMENEIKGWAKDGKDVSGFMKDNPEARLVGAGNATERTVSELRSRKRKLIAQNAPKATIKALEGQIAQQMKALNDQVKMTRMQRLR